jgi:glycosyltransferase involved in cell wall biosynthesis
MILALEPKSRYFQIIQIIKQLKLENHVILLEPVERDNLPSYLLAADCVVVPSISEGFGYAAVEAASIGCRVVVTSGHAVEEVLGKTAFYVPPNSPVSLATAILHIIESKPPIHPHPPIYTIENHIKSLNYIYSTILRRTRF